MPPSQAAAPPNRRRGNPESGARPRAGPPGRRVGPGAPPSRRGRSPSGSAGRDDVPGEPSRRLTRPRGAFVRFVSPPLRRPPASRRLSSTTASRGCPDSTLGLGGRVRFSRPSRGRRPFLPPERDSLGCAEARPTSPRLGVGWGGETGTSPPPTPGACALSLRGGAAV